MPVVTRSQSRLHFKKSISNDTLNKENINLNIQNETTIPVDSEKKEDDKSNKPVTMAEKAFAEIIKRKLSEISTCMRKSDKIFLAIYMFMYINEAFPSILKSEPWKWAKFAKTIMEKTFEFDEQEITYTFNIADKEHFVKLRTEYIKTRKLIWPYIKDVMVV